MRKSNRERMLGFVIAIGIAMICYGGVARFANSESSKSTKAPIFQLLAYATKAATKFEAIDASGVLQARDPVFLLQTDGSFLQCGHVVRASRTAGPSSVSVCWQEQSVSPQACRMTAYQNHGRLEDAIELMFPPEKRQRIEKVIAIAMQTHGERIGASLAPILERSLRDSLPAIESGFRQSVERHRGELDVLAARWNDEVIADRLVPLAKNEIVPIVRVRAEPVAQEIGLELWRRASIWSFTWRAIYDKSPLPQKDLMKQEWERFVAEEAIPVLEEHANEIASAVQETIVDIAGNPNVRQELAAAAELIASDPVARGLIQTLLREAFVENIALRKVWTDAWSSDEARAAIAKAGEALEPTIRQIGDELMGTRETGIDPGFARLLRNQVLQKDQRWVIATPGDVKNSGSEVLVIEAATERAVFPNPVFAQTVESEQSEIMIDKSVSGEAF